MRLVVCRCFFGGSVVGYGLEFVDRGANAVSCSVIVYAAVYLGLDFCRSLAVLVALGVSAWMVC